MSARMLCLPFHDHREIETLSEHGGSAAQHHWPSCLLPKHERMAALGNCLCVCSATKWSQKQFADKVRLSLGLLLSALETTIIATALVDISSSLGSFERSNWVVAAYLVTYTGISDFLISVVGH
jgi:hypothetical protein